MMFYLSGLKHSMKDTFLLHIITEFVVPYLFDFFSYFKLNLDSCSTYRFYFRVIKMQQKKNPIRMRFTRC